jgi:hypothetical protein
MHPGIVLFWASFVFSIVVAVVQTVALPKAQPQCLLIPTMKPAFVITTQEPTAAPTSERTTLEPTSEPSMYCPTVTPTALATPTLQPTLPSGDRRTVWALFFEWLISLFPCPNCAAASINSYKLIPTHSHDESNDAVVLPYYLRG